MAAKTPNPSSFPELQAEVAGVRHSKSGSPAGSGGSEARTGGLSKHTNLRFLIAVLTSLYGDWLTVVALVVVLYRLTGNPAGPAAFILVRVLPRLFGPNLGGGLADRHSPGLVVVVASVIQAALTAALVAAVQLHSLAGIYVLVAASQFFGSAARPAQQAIIPRLVPSGRLVSLNAAYSALASTAMVVSPALGAFLLQLTGPTALLAIDAASFLLCAALLVTLRTAMRRQTGAARPATGSRWSGLKVIAEDSFLRFTAIVFFVNAATIMCLQGVLVVAAQERFGGDTTVGYLYAAVGAGGLLAALISLRWHKLQYPARAVALVASIELCALLLFSYVRNPIIAAVCLAVSAVGSLYNIWGMTELQRRVLPALIGRASGIAATAVFAGCVAGAIWALIFTAFWSWSLTLQVLCGAALFTVVVSAIPAIRTEGRTGA